MTLIEKNLRCNIFWSAADSVSTLCHDLGETKINQLEVAIISDHNVLRLQITVANVLAVEVFEDRGDLRSIELGLLGRILAYGAMVREKITSTEQLRGKINVSFILEKAIVVQLKYIKKQKKVK